MQKIQMQKIQMQKIQMQKINISKITKNPILLFCPQLQVFGHPLISNALIFVPIPHVNNSSAADIKTKPFGSNHKT